MLEQLSAPFPPAKISWRVGAMTKDKTKAMALAYIDARDVMERLDDAVGPANWQSEYSHTHPAVCRIGIKIDGEWVWKSNGAGDTDVEAEKGALSDAFKRAAVLWGIGRYLYDVKSPWVAVDKYKKIETSEMGKLNNCLPRPSGKQQPAQKQIDAPKKDESTPFDQPVQRNELQELFVSIGTKLKEADGEQALQNAWADNEDGRKSLPQLGQEKLQKYFSNKMKTFKQAA